MKRQDKIERLRKIIGKVTICNGNVYVTSHGQEHKFGSVSEAHIYFFGY